MPTGDPDLYFYGAAAPGCTAVLLLAGTVLLAGLACRVPAARGRPARADARRPGVAARGGTGPARPGGRAG